MNWLLVLGGRVVLDCSSAFVDVGLVGVVWLVLVVIGGPVLVRMRDVVVIKREVDIDAVDTEAAV